MNRDLEKILRHVAAHGEVSADELVDLSSRPTGSYRDFYPLASHLHGGLLTTDTSTQQGNESARGTLGISMQDTACFLQRIATPKGQTFHFHDLKKESARGLPISFFMTSSGYAQLEQIDNNLSEGRKKTKELILTIVVSVFAAIVGGWASAYFQ